jgi:hypothetical protein
MIDSQVDPSVRFWAVVVGAVIYTALFLYIFFIFLDLVEKLSYSKIYNNSMAYIKRNYSNITIFVLIFTIACVVELKKICN